MDRAKIKRVNLALQGGGAHGAFGWGIFDKLTEDGRLEHSPSIRADEAMCNLSVASKLNRDWRFLCDLRDRGRAAAQRWLDENFDHLGHHATVDLRSDYLGAPAVHREHAHA